MLMRKNRKIKRKYIPLKFEIRRIWSMKSVKVIPIIIGALETITQYIAKWLKGIAIECSEELLHKA